MRSPRTVFALLALVLASLAALVALALSNTERDVESAHARYIAQVDACSRAVAAALDDETRASSGALTWSAGDDLMMSTPQVGRAAAPQFDDLQLREKIRQELDAADSSGDEATADQRLAQLTERTDRPELAAWAWTWTAARAQLRGRADAARAAWSALVGAYPTARDDHGLLRAFAARSSLAALDGDPLEALEALYIDAVADRADLDDGATATLAADVLARVRARDAAKADELAALGDRRTRELRFAASWPRGISNWVASGAEGGVRVFEFVGDPFANTTDDASTRGGAGTRGDANIVVTAQRDGSAWNGTALEVAALVRRALARPDIAAWRDLGCSACVEDAAGVALGGTAPIEGSYVAGTRAAAPLGHLTVRTSGANFDDVAKAARKRASLLASVAVAAALVGALAAFATVRALRREARAARDREQFVAAVTHELKTPLASIRLLAELLERGDVEPERVRDFGARTVAESDRLARLVDSVLRFARLQQGGALPPRETVDLVEVARAALRSVEPLAQLRGFTLELTAPQAPVLTLANADALIGVVTELIDNASKYGGAPHALEIEVFRVPGRVGVAVLDRGPGVPAAERERIFQPFHRVGDELTRERPGVGLGLALVRGVAESFGGTARYAPREGGGSRFVIELERAP